MLVAFHNQSPLITMIWGRFNAIHSRKLQLCPFSHVVCFSTLCTSTSVLCKDRTTKCCSIRYEMPSNSRNTHGVLNLNIFLPLIMAKVTIVWRFGAVTKATRPFTVISVMSGGGLFFSQGVNVLVKVKKSQCSSLFFL